MNAPAVSPAVLVTSDVKDVPGWMHVALQVCGRGIVDHARKLAALGVVERTIVLAYKDGSNRSAFMAGARASILHVCEHNDLLPPDLIASARDAVLADGAILVIFGRAEESGFAIVRDAQLAPGGDA